MKEYRVLWFDDEVEGNAGLRQIKDRALRNDIILEGVTNAEEGLRTLSDNLHSYDAVLVDGLFHVRAKDSGSAVSHDALRMVNIRLAELKERKMFPVFLLTGQANVISSSEGAKGVISVFHENKFYEKQRAIDDDFELWDDIKRACDEQLDVQLRHRYHKVFEACSEECLGYSVGVSMLKLIKLVHETTDDPDVEEYYNQLRVIIEELFRASNRFGLLHDACITNKGVNIQQASMFMSGQKCELLKIECRKSHFPRLIAQNLWNIIQVANSGSHSNDKDDQKVNITEYHKAVKSPFLLYSLVYQLMDILIWFKSYVDANPDVEKNKTLWVSLTPVASGAWVPGFLSSIHANGWGTFIPDGSAESLSIPPKLVSDNGLSEGTRIQVITKPSPDGTKTFITDIKI